VTWLIALGLAALAFAVLLFVFKLPRPSWEAAGAALLLGIAGYAVQASPGLPGAPKSAEIAPNDDGKALVEARLQLRNGPPQPSNSWLVISDALVRNGRYADASAMLLGATEKNPKDSEAWLALGIALVGHAEGSLSPAALYAFRQASAADPAAPGPPFFLGLALAQGGRFEEGRTLWAELLKAAPKDAPWRADLEARLKSLDAFIAEQQVAPR
jgi:cytochrome c-type biogenesis protein CcmH